MTAAVLVLLAQAEDGLTFALAVGHAGIGGESNALAAALYGVGGLPAILGLKAAGALACALIAWRLAPSRWALLPAVVGIAGAVTNVLAIV